MYGWIGISCTCVVVTVSVTAGGGCDGSELPSTFTIAYREPPWNSAKGSAVVETRRLDNAQRLIQLARTAIMFDFLRRRNLVDLQREGGAT